MTVTRRSLEVVLQIGLLTSLTRERMLNRWPKDPIRYIVQRIVRMVRISRIL